MSSVVYKYELGHGVTEVGITTCGRVLAVGTQGETIVMWALVDSRTLVAKRHFRVVFTGEWFEPGPRNVYIGTATTQRGFVVHVFETSAP